MVSGYRHDFLGHHFGRSVFLPRFKNHHRKIHIAYHSHGTYQFRPLIPPRRCQMYFSFSLSFFFLKDSVVLFWPLLFCFFFNIYRLGTSVQPDEDFHEFQISEFFWTQPNYSQMESFGSIRWVFFFNFISYIWFISPRSLIHVITVKSVKLQHHDDRNESGVFYTLSNIK